MSSKIEWIIDAHGDEQVLRLLFEAYPGVTTYNAAIQSEQGMRAGYRMPDRATAFDFAFKIQKVNAVRLKIASSPFECDIYMAPAKGQIVLWSGKDSEIAATRRVASDRAKVIKVIKFPHLKAV